MSYLVLARKWRPKTFADTVGQEHVLRALTNALTSGRLHHAYLFSGTRGVGKTTIARILAKALNCETGVTPAPCGECSACREIDEGRFVDLIEVDAASRTKVDDTRELLDNVQYAPARGRYKVYLIDEVHMLSRNSFNALLKTLEEPPPHVKFLLATTDPQKLPVTVLSRCLQFNLTRLSARLIHERLRAICDSESIEAGDPALAMIARAADGSLRDALSLLDQAIAYCGGVVEDGSVAAMLGTIDRNHVARLIELLAAGDAAGALHAVADIDRQFPDYARLLEDMARYFQRIAVYQVVGEVEDDDIDDPGHVEEFAQRMSASDIQLFYQTALIGRRDLYLAPDPRSGMEMTLLRMLAFRPAAADPAGSPVSARARRSGSVDATATPGSKQAQVSPAAVPAAAANRENPDWSAVVDGLGLSGAVGMLASNCTFVRRNGQTIHLAMDPRSESVLTASRKQALAEALTQYFGETIAVDIELVPLRTESPAQKESRKAHERLAEARRSLEADPNVLALKEMFGAEIKPDSVELRGSAQND